MSLRPHPYYRPKSQRHLLLPFMAPALLVTAGVAAGLSALGVPKGPWVAVPAVILLLVGALVLASGPTRDIPRFTWLWVLAVIVGSGFLLEVDERFAPVLLLAAYLLWRWVRSRPLLPVAEVEPGRWKPVDAAPPQTGGPDQVSGLASPAAAYDPGISSVGPGTPQLGIPMPNLRLRPSGQRGRRVFLSTRGLQVTLGLLSIGAVALGAIVIYASVFGDGNPVVAAIIGGLLGLLILVIGAAGLITVVLDLTRRVVIDSSGLRLTGVAGYAFTWDQIAAVAIVDDKSNRQAPIGIALTLSRPAEARLTYAEWDQVPPFTHLCPLRGGRPADELRREVAEALSTFVPDIYLGEVTR